MRRDRRAKMPIDVLLINPPPGPGTVVDRQGASGLGVIHPRRRRRPLPPHTLTQVGATVRSLGLSVAAIDLTRESPRRLHALLDRVAVVAGIFVSQKTLATDLEFIASLRQRIEPQQVLPFGISTWFHIEELRRQSRGGPVLVGEPESRFGHAALYLAGRAPAPPTGLLLDGEQPRGELHQLFVSDLDELPIPAWELLGRRWRELPLYASRGCYQSCRLCPHSVAQGVQVRGRAPANVAAEMQTLARRFGTRHFVFLDPAFGADPIRTLELCREIRGRRVKATWSCASRPDALPVDLLGRMAEAGCREVRIELDTLDPQLLVRFGRIPDIREHEFFRERVEIFVKTALRLGIHPQVTILDGLPGQMQGDVDATARFARSLGVRRIRITHHVHYPAVQALGT
ncbi:MAG: radical SAM protein [Planctomycetota bacterium]